MEDQNKNLILATVLSAIVILVWMVYFPPPEVAPVDPATVSEPVAPAVPDTTASTTADTTAIAAAARVNIETPQLTGSISTLGGRIDDLKLTQYRETLDAGSDTVRVLTPVGQDSAYYALFGWAPGPGLTATDVPDARTVWTVTSTAPLSPATPVTLQWQNGNGLTFTRTISIDDLFMFSVTDTVQNTGTAPASLAQYGIVARHGMPTNLQNIFVVHEGMISRVDGELTEMDYAEMVDLPVIEREAAHAEVTPATTDGWIGFTDHYWMTTLIPEQGKPYTAVAKYTPGADIYQAEVRQPVMTVAPGATITASQRLFAGAKEWEGIRNYQREDGIAGFLDSIDWGWFFFLTKPMFAVLHWLNALIGNMGLAIIGLTFVLKLIVLPLAYKSYVSMARMKELQPEMEALKERCGDDKQRMQKEMMQLYKDNKVNPAAGCLPILPQIPIFFALYKVIFVTIELRHAPFFGWLKDLSAPDASSLFNLFGLLPWAAPEPGSVLALIFIGVLPILLGISMWLQQKLNPAPTDPVQQQVFAWMPWIFMFMLGSFASGLVVYWITNNTITFVQQYLIMRSHGHKPDIFGNIRSSLSRKPAPTPAKPAAAKPAAAKPAAAKPAPAKPATAKPTAPKVAGSAPANRPAPPRSRKPRK
jgi:YidC/Oxa1 family membrane protein insertase